jgi:uncharacterized protein (UPF0335 family)
VGSAGNQDRAMDDNASLQGEEELGDNARKALAGYIERIERLTEEKKATAADIKAAYEEAVAAGFDKAAIKQIIKERAADTEKTVIFRGTVATYRRALGALMGTPLGEWARSWNSREAKMRLSEAKRNAEEGGELLKAFLGKKRRAAGDAADGEASDGAPL